MTQYTLTDDQARRELEEALKEYDLICKYNSTSVNKDIRRFSDEEIHADELVKFTDKPMSLEDHLNILSTLIQK